jgi:tetratricopeptide (TPR) repeat protein
MVDRLRLGGLLFALMLASGARAEAQADSAIFFRALDLEAEGKPREAAPLFRSAIRGPLAVNALLGLERVYEELGWTDSTLTAAEVVIRERPSEAAARTVELRALLGLGRTEAMWRAFERWRRERPRDPTPYRDLSRLLIERGRLTAADSVIDMARRELGSNQGLHVEIAQVRAAAGAWVASAVAWKSALEEAEYLEQAAAYALSPTPTEKRDSIRRALSDPPLVVAARLALAELESGWGSPEAGWEALRDLPPDSVVASAWNEFAARAERAERWSLARDALLKAMEWRRSTDVSLRAMNASLRAGDPAAALQLAPLPTGGDSAYVASSFVPLHVKALSALGRVAEGERLVRSFDRFLNPGERAAAARSLAFGWARLGEMQRARAALSAGGAEQDSSEAAGWIALYGGDLRGARALLRAAEEGGADLALALGLISRMGAPADSMIGKAFLNLARGDTATAGRLFESASAAHADVGSLLLAYAARLAAAGGDVARSDRIWRRIVDTHGDSPEAAEASLEIARSLLRQGERGAALSQLEDLLVRWPNSALAPMARRELELARRSNPG